MKTTQASGFQKLAKWTILTFLINLCPLDMLDFLRNFLTPCRCRYEQRRTEEYQALIAVKILFVTTGDYDFATLWIGRHYPSSCFSWGEKSFKEKVCKQQLCHWFQNATQTCQEIMNQLSIHSLFQMCQMEKDRQQHQQRFLFFTFQFPPCIVDCRKAYYVEQVAIKQMVWAQLKALYVCILLFFHIHMHTLFENYSKYRIFGAFSTNICPIKTDLSDDTVWPQASGFQKLATLHYSKCKSISLRSQCWKRLYLWFSNTVYASVSANLFVYAWIVHKWEA